MRSRLLRASVVLACGLVAAIAANGLRQRPPKFDPVIFRAEYEAAFHNRDMAFYEDLYSRDFWLGRQFPSRAATLTYLRGVFADYSDTQAQFHVDKLRRIAGGRAFALDATLTLTGRRAGKKETQEIASVIGSSFFTYEHGRWRIYKNIERLAPETAEQ